MMYHLMLRLLQRFLDMTLLFPFQVLLDVPYVVYDEILRLGNATKLPLGLTLPPRHRSCHKFLLRWNNVGHNLTVLVNLVTLSLLLDGDSSVRGRGGTILIGGIQTPQVLTFGLSRGTLGY